MDDVRFCFMCKIKSNINMSLFSGSIIMNILRLPSNFVYYTIHLSELIPTTSSIRAYSSLDSYTVLLVHCNIKTFPYCCFLL